MGKPKGKNRKPKAPKEVKTRVEREAEATHIRSQIASLGLGEGNPDVAVFFQELTRFVETGVAWTGNIKLRGHQRIIQAILTTRPSVTSSVSLAYQKDV